MCLCIPTHSRQYHALHLSQPIDGQMWPMSSSVRSVTILEQDGQYQAWSSGDAMCCEHANPPAHFMFASLRYPPQIAEHTRAEHFLCLHRMDDPGFEQTSHGLAAAFVSRMVAIGFMAFLLRKD